MSLQAGATATIKSDGTVRQLDGRPEPDEGITDAMVKDPKALARFLSRLLRNVYRLMRLWRPRSLDFEDKAVDATGTTVYSLPHNFGGRVRWYVVDWTGSAAYALSKSTSTTDNTLELVSYVAGTATIRVEEAG